MHRDFTMTSESWQLRCAELKQRGAYLYRSKLWSDCTFQLVGPPGDNFDVTIKAHKLIMAMASPVFSKMLYGSFVKFPVSIRDVRPEVFNILLEYIYSDNLNITSSKVACDLYHAAKKWKLPHVAQCCTIYLNEHMSPENICHIYKVACDNEDIMLQQTCEKVFSAKTKQILKDDSFYEADICIVKRFFSLDPLNIDNELDLFEAAVKYVTIQEARNVLQRTDEENSEESPPKKFRRASITPNDKSNMSDLEESPSNASECSDDDGEAHVIGTPTKDDVANVKDKLKYRELIANIRFLSLSPQQLATCTCLTALLTDAELLAVAMNVASQETTYEMPKGLSTCMVPRTLSTKEDRTRQSASFRSMIHNFKNIQKHESTYFYLRNLAWSLMVLTHNELYVLAVTCFFESGPPEWVKNTRVKVKFSTHRPVPKHLHKIAFKVRTSTPEYGAWVIKMNREDFLNPDYGFVDDLNTVSYKLYINTVPKQDESGELDELANTTLNSIADDPSIVALRRSKTPALDTSKNPSTIIASTGQIRTQSRSSLDTIITTCPRSHTNVTASQKSPQYCNATTIQPQSRPFATATTAQSRSSLGVTHVQTKSLSSATVTTAQSLKKPSTVVTYSQSQLVSSPSVATDLWQLRLTTSTNAASAQLHTQSSTLSTIQPHTLPSSPVGTGQSKTLSSPRATTDQSQLLSSPILTNSYSQSLTSPSVTSNQPQSLTSPKLTAGKQQSLTPTPTSGQVYSVSTPRTTGHTQSLTSRVTISQPQPLISKLTAGKSQLLTPTATTGQVQSVPTPRVTSVSLPQSQTLSSHKMATGQLQAHLSPNVAASQKSPQSSNATTIQSRPFPTVTTAQSRVSLGVTHVQTKSLSSAIVATTAHSLTKPSTLVTNNQSQLLSSSRSVATDLSQPRLTTSSNVATTLLQIQSSPLTTIESQTRPSSTVGTGQSKTLTSPRATTDKSQLLSSPILTTGHTQSLTAPKVTSNRPQSLTSFKLTTGKSQSLTPHTTTTGQVQSVPTSRMTSVSLPQSRSSSKLVPSQSQSLSSHKMTTGQLQTYLSPNVAASQKSPQSSNVTTIQSQSRPFATVTTAKSRLSPNSNVAAVHSRVSSGLPVASSTATISSLRITSGQNLHPTKLISTGRSTPELSPKSQLALSATKNYTARLVSSGVSTQELERLSRLGLTPVKIFCLHKLGLSLAAIGYLSQKKLTSRTINALLAQTQVSRYLIDYLNQTATTNSNMRDQPYPTIPSHVHSSMVNINSYYATSSGVSDPGQSKISSCVVTTSSSNSQQQLSEIITKKSPSPEHFPFVTSGLLVSTHLQTVHNTPSQQSSIEASMTLPQPKIMVCTSSTAGSSPSTQPCFSTFNSLPPLQTISTMQTDLKTADTPSKLLNFCDQGIFSLSEDAITVPHVSLTFTVASQIPSPLHAVTLPWPTKPTITITNAVGLLLPNTQFEIQSKSTKNLKCEKGSFEDNLLKPLTETNFKIKEINVKTESKEIALEENESVSQLKSLQEIAFTESKEIALEENESVSQLKSLKEIAFTLLKLIDKKQNKNIQKQKTGNTENTQTLLPKSLKDMTVFMLNNLIKNEENLIVSYQEHGVYIENKIDRVIDKDCEKTKMVEIKSTSAILPKSLKNMVLSELQKIITNPKAHKATTLGNNTYIENELFRVIMNNEERQRPKMVKNKNTPMISPKPLKDIILLELKKSFNYENVENETTTHPGNDPTNTYSEDEKQKFEIPLQKEDYQDNTVENSKMLVTVLNSMQTISSPILFSIESDDSNDMIDIASDVKPCILEEKSEFSENAEQPMAQLKINSNSSTPIKQPRTLKKITYSMLKVWF